MSFLVRNILRDWLPIQQVDLKNCILPYPKPWDKSFYLKYAYLGHFKNFNQAKIGPKQARRCPEQAIWGVPRIGKEGPHTGIRGRPAQICSALHDHLRGPTYPLAHLQENHNWAFNDCATGQGGVHIGLYLIFLAAFPLKPVRGPSLPVRSLSLLVWSPSLPDCRAPLCQPSKVYELNFFLKCLNYT